jgi:hypothetical protein
MRPIYFLFLIGLIPSLGVDARQIEGTIIFEHDTIDVVFNIPGRFRDGEPMFEYLQYRVKYFDPTGKKVRLRPDQAKEIRFRYGDEDVRMLSLYNSIGPRNTYPRKNVFLRLKVDGHLRLFYYYYNHNDASTDFSYNMEEPLLQMADGELKRPKVLGFRNDMVNYLCDCPSLTEKIEDKHFRKRDLESLVIWYNAHCIPSRQIQ